MITSVIEGVVDWLIFPHQIFCHDLMLSNINQWDWLGNEKALSLLCYFRTKPWQTGRDSATWRHRGARSWKTPPTASPAQTETSFSEIFAPFSVFTSLRLDLKLRFKWQPFLLCGSSNRSTMKGRELWEELPDDDEGGPGPPDLTCLNLSLPICQW